MAMSGLERKAALILHGTSMSAIARKLGISASQVSAVVLGKTRSRKVEIAVAQVLGKPHNEVFEPKAEAVA